MTASWWQRKAEESYGIAEDELTPVAAVVAARAAEGVQRGQAAPTRASPAGGRRTPRRRTTPAWRTPRPRSTTTPSPSSGKRKGQGWGCPASSPKRQGPPVLPVHHRHDPRRARPPACHPAPAGHDPHPRVHRASCSAASQAGTARILSATVRLERGRWFVSFQVEVEARARSASPARMRRWASTSGVKTLAVLADSSGEIRVRCPTRHLDHALKQLRRASRARLPPPGARPAHRTASRRSGG